MNRNFDDEWRRWIAENLMLDASPESIRATLVANDFDAAEAGREIDAALASPYLRGAERLRNRLRKRDWMLSVYGTLNGLRGGGVTIERRDRLSRNEFHEQYYVQNRPVIITGMIDDWPALSRWGFDYFRSRCGDADVEVQFGRDADANYEVNQPKLKRTMRFREYVDLVERSGPTNDFYMTANNTSLNRAALSALWEDVRPVDRYLDPASPDTGFFWFGPAGTKTPFHHDLTNNFMAQVLGRKRVKLIPFYDTPAVYNHLHCYSQVDGGTLDTVRFPALANAQVLDCTLSPGELLFLPIGWWHYVEGLDVSVTMTFINFLARNEFSAQYRTYHAV